MEVHFSVTACSTCWAVAPMDPLLQAQAAFDFASLKSNELACPYLTSLEAYSEQVCRYLPATYYLRCAYYYYLMKVDYFLANFSSLNSICQVFYLNRAYPYSYH